jgi:hypothetical protein
MSPPVLLYPQSPATLPEYSSQVSTGLLQLGEV